MKTKSVALKIIAEELKKGGVEIAEEALEDAVKIVFEKALPRIAMEETNVAIKSIAGVAVMTYPAIKPALDKATDLNHDGQ